jgi:N-acetylmuramoyl-L-alanine amidase
MVLDMRERPSPNFDDRRGFEVSILVLHYTGMPTAAASLDRLADPNPPRVSCHYLIEEDGTLWRMVEESARAWHAGAGSWRGVTDVNSASIGIELQNPGHEFGYRPFPPAQMAVLAQLCQGIIARHAIPPGNVIAHSDLAPERKDDPGELFDWEWLAAQGVGAQPPRINGIGPLRDLAPGEVSVDVAKLQTDLGRYGYGLPVTSAYDAATEKTVIAFQRHFRRRQVTGVADGETRAVLAQLLAGEDALHWLGGGDG